MTLKASVALLVLLLILLASAAGPSRSGGDPGLVAVVGEDPAAAEFSLPALSPYKFDYQTVRLSLWDTVSKDNLVPPDTVFTAPTVPADFDADGDVDLDDFGAFAACLNGANNPPAPACPPGVDADLDDDGDVDLDDFGIFGQQYTGSGNRATVSITVFVEGLIPSTALGDTTITLLDDPDGDDIFTVVATQAVTVVSITISPTSGLLGTAVNVNMQPAIPPLAFSSETTATWSGVFIPNDTPPTDPFVTEYDAQAIHESGPEAATLILGEGTITSGNPGQPSLGGIVDGALTLHLGQADVGKSLLFTVEPSYTYVQGAGGAGDPVGGVDVLDAIPPWNQYVTLENSYAAHVLLTILAEKNTFTEAVAPTALAIELLSEDAGGIEIDRLVLTCYLEQDRGDDFGPDRLVYYSDWEQPIVFVNHFVDDALHPTLNVLQVDPAGRVYPVFGTP